MTKVIGNSKEMSYEEWKEVRKTGIGGSDVAVVLNQNKYKSAIELFYEKVGYPDENEFQGNLQTQIGNLLEDVVASVFLIKTGFKLIEDNNIYQHEEKTFLLANIDYIVEDYMGNKAILECKTCSFSRGLTIKEAIPTEYELQCRHYMYVLDIDVCYLAVLYDNNENGFFYHEIKRDREIEKDIVNNLEFFWNYNVANCIEPTISFTNESTKEFIDKFYNKKVDEIELDGLTEVVEAYNKANDEKSKAKKVYENISGLVDEKKLEIISSLKGHEKGVIGNYVVTYKSSVKETINKDGLAKLKLEFPDVYNKYVTLSESKRFSLKEKKEKKESNEKVINITINQSGDNCKHIDYVETINL